VGTTIHAAFICQDPQEPICQGTASLGCRTEAERKDLINIGLALPLHAQQPPGQQDALGMS